MGFAWRVVRGHGTDGARDGLVHRNVLAGYAHQRSVGGNDWPARFAAHVRASRERAAIDPKAAHFVELPA